VFSASSLPRGYKGTKKVVPVPLCPPQIPYDLNWDGTRTIAVGIQRLTARTQPACNSENALQIQERLTLLCVTKLKQRFNRVQTLLAMLFEITVQPDTKPGSRVSCFTSMPIIRPSRPVQVCDSAEKNGILFLSGCHLSPRDVCAAFDTNV
jgi:hypothetical protein